MSSPGLPFGDGVESLESRLDARDREGRARAVDPRYNVALEASAGTGKTRVLVNRYVNLLKANVDPVNVLAVTFTRKAAAEMRERIMATLKEAAERGELTPTRWRELRDRTGDISVSTIDAFCLSLLREFPLEADLDPGFSLADETEAPRLVQESLDRALRTCRALAREDAEVALVFAQLGDSRARRGLAALLNRRLVAPDVLRRYLERGPSDLTVDGVVDRAARALCEAFDAVRGGLDGFRASGPRHPGFQVLVRHVEAVKAAVDRGERVDPGLVQAAYARTRDHFLTRDGEPRRRLAYTSKTFLNETVRKVHLNLVHDHGADILRLAQAFRRDLNVLVARGTARMYRVAETEYRRTLEAHAVLDFSDVLLRALDLVRQMEEFAQSRFRLESRYHHVLVDEFQDTSRAQWELVAQLVQAWGAGVGAAYEGPLPPSVFIVGDRKQSIYGFRDADVSLLQEASRHLESLRPDRDVRRSISRSFRSVAPILSFVNDVCRDVEKVPDRPDAFVYDEQDRFPLGQVTAGDDRPLGLVVAETPEECAAITADEIGRLLAARVVVRDRDTGVRRPITPADVAILFRTRESHREFETALERLGIAVHVYKGLGFFDADEIKDVRALLWSLADPASELRTAAVLRSGFVGLSDEGLRLLAPRLSQALYHAHAPAALDALDAEDRATLRDARVAFARWRSLVDRLPAGDLLEQVLRESGYAVELRGPRFEQARENLKKVRSLVRRVQNRGYATLARVAAHLDHLAIGDEANAPVDARDAVSLMTVHASKGLEFPVVFVVNLARGTMSFRDPIRVSTDVTEDPVTVGDFRSDTDQDQPGRDREETKRLLYVALTRARDRLYLGTVVKEGRMQPGRGSLGEVLPKSLQAVFSATASGDAAVWTASSGQAHRLTWCTRGAAVSAVVGEATPVRPADREPLSAVPEGCSVTEAIGAEETVGGTGVPGSDRLLGLAVHRLLDRRGFTPLAPDQQRSAVLDVLASGERAEVGDVEAFVATVADAYAALCSRDDVREMLESGQCFHEVPFSLRLGPRTVRGTVDCLVRLPDKRLVVLEFKTGRPRPEHEAQVALYCQAARTIFPDCTVEARLIYPPEA